MKTALIFGVTGLTGKALLQVLINDNRYEKIYIVTRKPFGGVHFKVEEILFNYKSFSEMPQLKADHVFSCLGTTIKKAGSKEAQQIIDRDYPIEIAKYCAKIGSEKLITISSVGADPHSKNFYLKTKGEMEEGVKKHFPSAIFVRPSFILGEREERRIGEKIGIGVFNIINPLLFGGLSKYKGIRVEKLGQTMIEACFKSTPQVIHYNEFVK